MKLTANDQVFIKLTAHGGNYEKTINGSAKDLGLVDFPINWLDGDTNEMIDFSEVIERFYNNSNDDFMLNIGSSEDFRSSAKLHAIITRENAEVFESKENNPFG